MKFDQVKDVVAKAVSETLGDTYMNESGLYRLPNHIELPTLGKLLLMLDPQNHLLKL